MTNSGSSFFLTAFFGFAASFFGFASFLGAAFLTSAFFGFAFGSAFFFGVVGSALGSAFFAVLGFVLVSGAFVSSGSNSFAASIIFAAPPSLSPSTFEASFAGSALESFKGLLKPASLSFSSILGPTPATSDNFGFFDIHFAS